MHSCTYHGFEAYLNFIFFQVHTHPCPLQVSTAKLYLALVNQSSTAEGESNAMHAYVPYAIAMQSNAHSDESEENNPTASDPP